MKYLPFYEDGRRCMETAGGFCCPSLGLQGYATAAALRKAIRQARWTMERKDYMEGRVSFQQYYTAIGERLGCSFVGHPMLDLIRTALRNGDEHLNSIVLRRWDELGAALSRTPGYRAVLREFGEFDSLSARVCVLKACAIRDAEEVADGKV